MSARRVSDRALVTAAVLLGVVLLAAVALVVWVVRVPAMDRVPIPSVSRG